MAHQNLLYLLEMVMDTFTAALLCCLMDSLFAGASTWLLTLVGCLFGTEGKNLDCIYVSQLLEWKMKHIPPFYFLSLIQNDDHGSGVSYFCHSHKLLHDLLRVSWASCLWSLAKEVPQRRAVVDPCAGQWNNEFIV